AAAGLGVGRGLGNALVPQYRGDRAGDAVGCRHVPRPIARGEAEADEQRVTTRQVHVRVDGEGAGPAEFLSDLVRVDIGDERDVRGPGGGARGLGGGAPQLLETE